MNLTESRKQNKIEEKIIKISDEIRFKNDSFKIEWEKREQELYNEARRNGIPEKDIKGQDGIDEEIKELKKKETFPTLLHERNWEILKQREKDEKKEPEIVDEKEVPKKSINSKAGELHEKAQAKKKKENEENELEEDYAYLDSNEAYKKAFLAVVELYDIDDIECNRMIGEINAMASKNGLDNLIKKFLKDNNKKVNYFSFESFLSWKMDLVKKEGKERFKRVSPETPVTQKLRGDIMGMISRKRSVGTEMLLTEFLKRYYIYTTREDKNCEVWIWKNGIYVPEGRTYIREFCRKVLGAMSTPQLKNEVISKIEDETFIEADEFFANNYPKIVAVQNGLLNVVTRKLEPFTPEKIFFNKLPVSYDPDKRCPKVVKFLNDILPDSTDVQVVIELIGYCLLKENRFEKAFMLNGRGRNGKSKLLDLIKHLVGIENVCGIAIHQFENDPYAVGELLNKMVNLAGDVGASALKDTEVFKQVTGRDAVSANRKFKNRVTFIPYAKQIFACNQMPSAYDLSEGFWMRWVYLEFPYTFITEKEYEDLNEEDRKNKKIRDPDIIEKITSPEEMSGLLNIALSGLATLLKNKDFSYSKTAKEVQDSWTRRANSFKAFFEDEVVVDYKSKTPKNELKKEYAKYCLKHNVPVISDRAINFFLTKKGISYERYRKSTGTDRIDVYYWLGVHFKKEVLDDDGFSFREHISEKQTRLAKVATKEEPKMQIQEEEIEEDTRKDTTNQDLEKTPKKDTKTPKKDTKPFKIILFDKDGNKYTNDIRFVQLAQLNQKIRLDAQNLILPYNVKTGVKLGKLVKSNFTRDNLLDFIRQHQGVSAHQIKMEFGVSDEKADSMMMELQRDGEIFEASPDNWRAL